MARKLGKITSHYRWFSIVYLLLMFFIFPAIIFGLSLAGPVYLYIVLVPVALVIIATSIITKMQQKFPDYLPKKLRSWDFLPKPLISLDPYDRVIQKMISCNMAQYVTRGCRKSRRITNPIMK